MDGCQVVSVNTDQDAQTSGSGSDPGLGLLLLDV